jgi:uncharacterized damage-inducible protein DinB
LEDGMNTMVELRELLAYNRWADERMLTAGAAVSNDDFVRDMRSSFPSVRDTLVHIMSAEWVWLHRLQGVSPDAMPAEWLTLDLPGIAAAWAGIHAATTSYLDALDEVQLHEPITYRTLAGQQFTSTPGQILRHVVNHSTYHRGQLTTMLRQLGAVAPATDLILFYRASVPAQPLSPG